MITQGWARSDRNCFAAATATAVLRAERLPTGDGWLPLAVTMTAEGVTEIRGPVQTTRLAAQRWAARAAQEA